MCHIPTEYGEPMVLHMIPCCDKCEVCGKQIK